MQRLAEGQKKLQDVAALKSEIAKKLADPAYAGSFQQRDLKVQADEVQKASEALVKEIQLRDSYQQAWAAAPSPKESAPSVKAAQSELSKHYGGPYKSFYKKPGVASVCVPCMRSSVESVSNSADYPLTSTLSKRGISKEGQANAVDILKALKKAGITDKKAQANILAQIEDESKYLPKLERTDFSAKRLFELWGPGQSKNTVHFKTIEDATKLVAKGEEAVVNVIYAHTVPKNGQPGDAYRFRGRGFIQLTGRENYSTVGTAIKKDLLNFPDDALQKETALQVIAPYFLKVKGLTVEDLSNIDKVTKAVAPGEKDDPAQRRKLAEDIEKTL